MHQGSCLCGAVSFRNDAPLGAPIACHCIQCRKQSGHHFAALPASWSALSFDGDDSLTWYRASANAARGFCSLCGSTLFWRGDASQTVMIAMGALETTSDMTLSAHYWVSFKGDYYDIADDLPQYPEGAA